MASVFPTARPLGYLNHSELVRNGFKYFCVIFLLKPFLCGNISFKFRSTDPWNYLDIFWTLAFSLIVMAALLGNCLVLWIVCGEVFVVAKDGQAS